MDNGIYVTLSRQLALFRDMEVTANNIANANTTGFNSEHMIFNTYLDKDINQGERNPMAFAHDIDTYRNTENGSMHVTGNDLDVAIAGEGYFTLQTPMGIRYTKAGSFQTDANGILTSPEGYPVLDATGQEIIFPEDTVEIAIGEAGNISVNGQEFSTLGIAEFSNPQLLERLDNKLFKSDVEPDFPEHSRVLQGTLESANVKPVVELTHMIDVSRSVGSTAKFIEVMYDLERKATNTWAQQS